MLRVILLLLLTGTTGPGASQMRSESRPLAVADAARNAVAEAATAALSADLEKMIDGAGWRGDEWSVLVVSLDRGDTLFSHAADALLAPASNVKLFTTAAALYYLGPDFRFNTFLLTAGAISDGVLEGDLVLYGTGDPTIAERFGMRQTVWQAFADTLLGLGVREVRGDIVGDASYYTGPGSAPGWQDSYIDAGYAAPASALSYAENIATLRIRPAQQAGWRPEVALVPGGEGIGIVNQATTVARGGRTTIRLFRTTYGAPLTVTGQIAVGSPAVLRAAPLSDPPRYAAAVFREVLATNGIVVSGEIRAVERPEESPVSGRSVFAPAFDQRAPIRVLAIHNSPPLIEVLDVVNKRSHNLLAEQVLRSVGRVATGEGSVEGGVRAVRHMLEREGNGGSSGLELYDGSGLSVLNRASARSFIALLAFMRGSQMWESFWSTLPEAGARDGLRRMGRTAAEGNLRAKTGTINRVSALSGYVRAANGETLAFSIVSNQVPSTWRAKRIEDAIGARLAGFTRPGDVLTSEPVVELEVGSEVGDTTAPAKATPAESVTDRPGEAAAPAATEYTIRRGDTLDRIAKQHGTTVAALQKLNPRLNPRRLLPGTKIRVR